MSETMGERPAAGEYDPFYETYVGRLEAGPILPSLTSQGKMLRDLIAGLAPGGGDYRYAPNKWSIKELLGHLNDTERILGMRATCIARGEVAELPGFDQDDYVAAGYFALRPIDSLLREFEFLRAANVEMLRGLSAEDWKRSGNANGSPVSVRALGWILAGHVDHHIAVIGERYDQAFNDR